MEALIINLPGAAERMAFQKKQMKALGLAYTRLNACDVNAIARYSTAYWNTWERPLRDTEKACFLSHRQAWAAVAAQNRPALILEDDAVLSSDTPAFLNSLAFVEGIDLLTLETRARKKLVARKQSSQEEKLGIRRVYQDRSGAAAYILWPAGARKLLQRTQRRAGLADAVICAAYELKTFQADPALAMQIDRCEAYRLTPPIKTQSSILTCDVPAPRETHLTVARLRFRVRRLYSQLRMGIRFVTKALFAERRYIEPTQKSSFDAS